METTLSAVPEITQHQKPDLELTIRARKDRTDYSTSQVSLEIFLGGLHSEEITKHGRVDDLTPNQTDHAVHFHPPEAIAGVSVQHLNNIAALHGQVAGLKATLAD